MKWTYLSERQISAELDLKQVPVSRYLVKQLLRFRAYKKRNLLKMNTLKEVEGRNEQFERIATYRQSFKQNGLPILSIDTKKKEMLGNFSRPGTAYATGQRRANDHDFLSSSGGQIVPHGIYDVCDNTGYLTLGLSKDTSAFVCDNLLAWWQERLQYKYPDAETILLLCDGGGSNASAHYIVKEDLSKLAQCLNMNILVAHYPPYCSKWNPIEHRFFSQLSHTWSGVSFPTVEFVKELSDHTSTTTGLKVFTSINHKEYFTGREVDPIFKANMAASVLFDEQRPKWNYLIKGRI